MDDLTDEQIDDLLFKAEQRLRNTNDSISLELGDENSTTHKKQRNTDSENALQPYLKTRDGVAIADPRALIQKNARVMANGIREVEDPLTVKKRNLEAKQATAGAMWYNLPRTNLTPELKRDLDLLRMRSVLDPKRFYKKENSKAKPPEFSQMSTVISGPTDFFSGRLSKKMSKRTLAEEIMAGEKESGKLHQQYNDVQKRTTSGKKGDYRKRMERRYGARYKKP